MQQQKLQSDFQTVLQKFADIQKRSAQKERQYIAQAIKEQNTKQEILKQ